MKRFLLWAFLSIGTLFWGQSRDLYSLAKGEYLGFNVIFDQEENLYGYVAIYGYGKSGEKTKKFEYVLLDKNLNPVSNKEFEGDVTARNYYAVLNFRNELMLIPYPDQMAVSAKKYFSPRTMVVNLKTNEIKHKVYYDYQKDGTFKEIPEPKNHKELEKEIKEERRKNGFVHYARVYEIKEGGYLVSESDDYEKYIKNQALKRYDENKTLLWEYRYNEAGDRKHKEYIEVIDKDAKHIYTILTKVENKGKTFTLQIFDINTGKIVSSKKLEGLNQETWDRITSVYDFWQSIDNDKVFDDKIVMVGRLYEEKPNKNKSIGFVRFIVDKKTFNTEVKELYFSDFNKFLPSVDKNGMLGNGYELSSRDFFFMKDGSVGLLFEKYKVAAFDIRTTDMVYAFTDKDFKLKDVKVFEKTLQKIM